MKNANTFPDDEIPSVLAKVQLAPRQVAKDVTLWPLTLSSVDPAPGERSGCELWPLDEALDDGFVGIVAGRGCHEARVESRAPAPVWIPAGEPVGGLGVAAESRVLPPHASTRVALCEPSAGVACGRCGRSLAGGFRPVEGQVGFAVSVHDRAVALELVLPAGLLARRLRRRVEAWAPFLLSIEVGAGPIGFGSPEELVAAVARDGPEGLAGARVGLVSPAGARGL